MKKFMKRILSSVLVLTLVMAVSVSAMAATPAVSVVVDGNPISFTDAAPAIQDGHTMLPLTAVLTAMGGTTSWDAATSTVTATLDGATLKMAVGSTNATLTKNGATSKLTMSVAPYVDSTSYRTYVPVRFATEAFGCNVGWDQASKTVIIVDTQKLAAQILSKYQYTTLQKYLAYSEAQKQSNLQTSGTYSMSAVALGSTMLSVNGTIDAVSAGQSAVQETATLNMDMLNLLKLMGTDPTEAGLSADGKLSTTMQVRGDLTKGIIYANYDKAMAAKMGLSSDSWISIDMNSLLSESGSGTTWSELLSQRIDGAQLLTAAASAISIDGKVTTAYQDMSTQLNALAAAVSDTGFTKTSTGYEAKLPLTAFGATSGTLTFDLTANASGAITGYSLACDATVPTDFITKEMDAATLSTLSAFGGVPKTMDLKMTSATDSSGTTMNLTVNVGSVASFTMALNATYKTATTTPVTTPPAGATVVPFTSLISSGT